MSNGHGPQVSASLAQLREFVGIIAAPAEDQREYLRANHLPIDELLLQLVDALDTYVGWLVNQSALSRQAADKIRNLADLMVTFEAGRGLWSVEALETAPEWERVRAFAHNVLAQLPRSDAAS